MMKDARRKEMSRKVLLSRDLLKECLSLDATAETIQDYICRGADVSVRSENGYNCLHYAAMNDTREDESRLIETLVRAGADLEARANTDSGDSWTPLMVAAWEGYASQLIALIRFGADVEAKGENDRTALMLAVSQTFERLEKVKALLAAGARVLRKDADGDAALDRARRFLEMVVEDNEFSASLRKRGEAEYQEYVAEAREVVRLLEEIAATEKA